MVKRFYPNKSDLKKLLEFKNLPKDVQNVIAENNNIVVTFLKFTHDERQTKISICNQQVMKYRGGQAFIQTKMLGTISYFRDEKKVYTKDPKRVIEYLQQHFYIAKAIQVDPFITRNSTNNWGAISAGSSLDNIFITLESKMFGHKNILKAIFRGNCTNRDNAVRRYCKSIYGFNISLKVYCEMQRRTNNYSLESVFLTTTNIQNAHKFMTSKAQGFTHKQITIMNDLMQMSLTMRKKINFAWTPRRMEEEHDKLVMEMVKLQAEGTPFVGVEYEVEPPTIPGITFFKNNRELLMESKLMKHCIGTSKFYIQKLVNFKSLLIAYDRLGERGTADIAISYSRDGAGALNLASSQFYSRGNIDMSANAKEDLKQVMKLIENSEFAEYLVKRKETKVEVKKESTFTWAYGEPVPVLAPAHNHHYDEDIEDVLMPHQLPEGGLPF